MRVEDRTRLDDDLLDELGVASTRFYRAELERIQLAQRGHGTTTYAVARDAAGRAVGMLPVYVTTPPWHPVSDPDALFGYGGSTLCVAGSYGLYENYLTAPAAPVATALVERARALARAAGSPHVMLPHLDAAQAGWLDGYDAVAAAECDKAVLPVTWRSFEEYVSWLPARRRTPVRRERSRFRDSGVEVRERPMSEVAGELAPLLAATERRYGHAADPRQIEFHYTLLAMDLADDFVALVAYLADRPVACSLLLACGDRWISKAWGCDYAAAGNQFLYFNLLFYEPVRRAIERDIAVLDYGTGGLETKTQRGCVREPLRTVLVAADR
ncbi:GNAT family N-acetyltransferase [Asanoa ishikariensis]|uniref:GNAT family N-acetyltransferase n=1 Tax=Asanoa ishikariensis TaxID=137265 RepID=UPI00159F7582|nr:GNAT family N-acetyltransferase [Asanoa ishikariensis]